jgi:ferredoxin-NADP reductase
MAGWSLPRRWRTALEQAHRDAAMLMRSARGRRAPFLVPRQAGAAEVAGAVPTPASTRRPLVVGKLVRETDDALSVHLRDTEGRALAFEAGQFLTIELDVEGERLKRAYSISTSPLDGAVAITVKRIQGGRASSFVNEKLREGDVVHARGPSGTFTVAPAKGPRHLLMLAGGSGITPIHSIARTVLAREPETRVTLIYGNRSERDIIFRASLEALREVHAGRLTIDHVLGLPPRGFTGGKGLLDRQGIDARLDALGIEIDDATEIFVCGPEPMRRAAREAFAARGVAPARIREEIFVRPELRVSDKELPREPVRAKIQRGGVDHGVLVRPGQSILEAATSAGVPLSFSCAMGGCGTCMLRLVDGEVRMEEPNCLTEEERAAGMVLACVSRPLGPVTLEAR